jgi:hypothetical protein
MAESHVDYRTSWCEKELDHEEKGCPGADRGSMH